MRTVAQIRQQIASLRRELRQRKSERIGTVIRKGRGSRDRDEELRAQRGYQDPGTYVRRDGSEVLKGKDWLKRKDELRERSGGTCEYRLLGVQRCVCVATIPAHVIPRHPRRNDELKNLMHYCPTHDRLTEVQSWRKPRFGEKAVSR